MTLCRPSAEWDTLWCGWGGTWAEQKQDCQHILEPVTSVMAGNKPIKMEGSDWVY